MGIGGTLTSPAPILVRVAVLVLKVPVRREVVTRPEPAERALAEPLGGMSPSVGGDAVSTPPSVWPPSPATWPPRFRSATLALAASAASLDIAIFPQTSQ